MWNPPSRAYASQGPDPVGPRRCFVLEIGDSAAALCVALGKRVRQRGMESSGPAGDTLLRADGTLEALPGIVGLRCGLHYPITGRDGDRLF